MIIILVLIFLLLAGAVSVDVFSTVTGGAIFAVVLLLVLIVKSNNRGKNAPQPEPEAPQMIIKQGKQYCDDCKYCYGDSRGGSCLLGHNNPQTGVFSVACDEDFLPRSSPLPQTPKRKTDNDRTSPENNTIEAPGKIGDAYCVYQYYDVPIVSQASNLSAGTLLHFSTSGNQVSILAYSSTVGFMKPGRLCHMVQDWLSRGDPVWAAVTSTDDSTGVSSFVLFFYRNEMKYMLERDPDAKQYRLTGNLSGELQENVLYCEVGQECTLEADDDKGKYGVCADVPIGFLPAAAVKAMEEFGPESARVFISRTETDEEGRTIVYIYLFP